MTKSKYSLRIFHCYLADMCSIILCCALFLYIFSIMSGVVNSKNIDILKEECGITKYDQVDYKIIEGEAASLGQFPWMARVGFLIQKRPVFVCAGALLNRYYILTAAHCGKNQIIRLGEHFTNSLVDCEKGVCAPPHQDIKVKNQLFHDYTPENFKNDVSLILLEKPVKFNDYVKPICLPHGELLSNNLMYSSVYAAGWGVTNIPSNKKPTRLMYTVMPVIEHENCNKIYTHPLDIAQLCIGYNEGGRDTCTGDSGGPLTKSMRVNNVRRAYVIGIVSYGLRECGTAPAVYVNVTHYVDWILENIKQS